MRIGLGQMLVEGGDYDGNLRRAARMAERASAEGCDFLVLPECLDAGWTHPSARDLARPVPGPTSDFYANLARLHALTIVAGLTERAGERIYNAAVMLSPSGDVLCRHRKINELEIAHDLYSLGESLSVAVTPAGRVAVNICADNFPDSLMLAKAQARMGARLFFSPCAWAVDADHDNAADPYGALWISAYGELARLHEVYVVGVSNVGWLRAGPWAGRKCIGCSLAVGPGGAVLLQGPYGVDAEHLLTVDTQF